jgi:DNA polymerase
MNKQQIDDKIQKCKKCYLCSFHANLHNESAGTGKLLGWFGGSTADFMFVGMNPSHNRFPGLQYAFGGKGYDQGTGVEFVKLLEDVGVLERSYVTNLVKCSTESNQISKDQIIACEENLRDEIELVKPKVLIAMGRLVSQFIKRNVQFYEFLIYNSIELKEIWHPNFVYSYGRHRIEEYRRSISEATAG